MPTGGVAELPIKPLAAPTKGGDAVNRQYVDQSVLNLNPQTVVGTLPAARLPSFTGVIAGQYTSVSVDNKGRVTMGCALVNADAPPLSWSKVTERPSTLAGYGITDALPLSGAGLKGMLSVPISPTLASQLASKGYVDSELNNAAITIPCSRPPDLQSARDRCPRRLGALQPHQVLNSMTLGPFGSHLLFFTLRYHHAF
jgi:hypothetical protein